MENVAIEFSWLDIRDALRRMFSDVGAKEVGRRVGLKKAAVYHLVCGRRRPSQRSMTRIARAIADWHPEEFGALRRYVGLSDVRLVLDTYADGMRTRR